MLVTQMLAPSNAMPMGSPGAGNVPRFAPSDARNLVTMPLPMSDSLATQMLAPSKAMPNGQSKPATYLPNLAPSPARRR